MRNMITIILPAALHHPQLRRKLQIINLKSLLQERIIKPITIITSNDIRVITLHEISKSKQRIFLGPLVENSYVACELHSGLVLELVYLLAAETEVDDEEGLALVHEGDHHDLVFLGVGEF